MRRSVTSLPRRGSCWRVLRAPICLTPPPPTPPRSPRGLGCLRNYLQGRQPSPCWPILLDDVPDDLLSQPLHHWPLWPLWALLCNQRRRQFAMHVHQQWALMHIPFAHSGHCCRRYWAKPEALRRIQTEISKHLPILVFGRDRNDRLTTGAAHYSCCCVAAALSFS